MPMSKYPNLEIAEEEVPPETPNQEDIFKSAPNDNFEEVEDDAPKTKKPKRKMSQKQLDHLTKIRTKAQATRKAKAKAKKELKDKGMEEEEEEVGDTGLSKKEEEEKYEKDYNKSYEPKINTPSRVLTAAEIRKIAREEAKAEKEDRKRIKQKERAKKDDIEKARQEGIAMGRQQITDSIGQYVGNRKTPKPSSSKPPSVPKPRATFGNPKLDALLNY